MTGQAPLGTELQPPGSLSLPAPVYGFDPGTQRVSVASVMKGLEGAETLSLTREKDRQRRWGVWYGELVPWLADLSERVGWIKPSHVFVEEPFMPKDRRQPPASYYMMGVLWAAIGAVLPDARLVEINAPAWKMRAMGQGNGGATPERYMAWARANGYRGSIEDECAAIGIATAGGVIVSGG